MMLQSQLIRFFAESGPAVVDLGDEDVEYDKIYGSVADHPHTASQRGLGRVE